MLFIQHTTAFSLHVHIYFLQANIDYIYGDGQFTSDGSIEVNGEKYTGKHILIATGGYPTIPTNIPGE